MKAWIYRRYGGPEVLEWADVDDPVPGPGEIGLKVAAAGLNPLDWKLPEGQFKVMMTLGRLPRGVGLDVAGVVDAVGTGVTSFKVGDAVVAAIHPMGSRQGTAAERVCASASLATAKPESLAFTDAAALGGSGFTAMQTLRQAGAGAGQRALIIGAAGGVGSFAVLLAKIQGLHVTAVAGAASQEHLRRLAADRAIDYSREDWRRLPERFDIVFDCSGTTTFDECRSLLTDSGVYANTLPNAKLYCRHWWLGATSKQRIVPVMERPNLADLESLVRLAAEGRLRVPVTRVSDMSELPQRLAEMRTGHGQGKIVVRHPLPAAPAKASPT